MNTYLMQAAVWLSVFYTENYSSFLLYKSLLFLDKAEFVNIIYMERIWYVCKIKDK